MRLVFKRPTNKKGQVAAVFNLFLAVVAIILIAGFCFELSRYFLARDELKTNTEAAALCCETALVSSGDPTNATNQTNAVSTALTLFQQNTILGQSMANAIAQSSISELSPSPGQAQVCFQFLDPVTRQPINSSANTPASGALIQATGAYCYTPSFGQFIGIGNAQFTFEVSAYSGVPRIDVVLAFDASGGMGYDTPVTTVQRSSNATTGGSPPNTTGGNPTTTSGTTSGGPCNPSTGIKYMLPLGPNNAAFLGGTIADLCGHPGGGNTALPSAIFPNHLEYLANFPGAPVFTEQTGAGTQYLAGYNGNTNTPAYMNVAPGDYCPCTGNNNNNNNNNNGNSNGNSNSNGNGDTNSPSTSTTGSPGGTTSINNNPDPGNSTTGNSTSPVLNLNSPSSYGYGDKTNINKSGSDENLLSLCAKLSSHSNVHSQKRDLADQIDEKRLSAASFKPLMVAVPTAQGSSSATSTSSNSSASTVSSSGTTGTTQEAAFQYNGYYYCASSHLPGGATTSPSNNAIPGYQCVSNTASPVGSGPSYANTLTDIVANIDGNNTFWGNYTDSSSYTFFDPSTMVEAARNNLESTSNAQSSFVDYGGMGITPTPGYSSAYYLDASYVVQPLNDLLYAAAALVDEMKNVADAHFSFIAFNDTAGNASTGINPPQFSNTPQAGYVPMISSWFPYAAPIPGGANSAIYVLPSLPFVALDQNNNNDGLISQLPPIYPNGNRNVSSVLNAAVSQLKNNGRPGANQAIILFCSGVPTEANQSNNQALQDAVSAVQSANTNIPIYCVCISDPNSTSSPTDDSANDSAYGTSGGLTAISAPGPGIGPKYYRVDYSTATGTQGNLSSVVDNIVRQMVGMMH